MRLAYCEVMWYNSFAERGEWQTFRFCFARRFKKLGKKMKKQISIYAIIAFGSLLYGIGTVLFIFPNEILLGGTSGIALLISRWFSVTPGTVSVIMNLALLVSAFFILGRDMAVKTAVGAGLTAISIGIFEKVFSLDAPILESDFLAAAAGASIIALASAMMFYVDSSSGGTDIIALVVKKYTKINIGTALLISDIAIVIVGGIVMGGWTIISSFEGFLIKVLGIDLIIYIIRKIIIKKQKV